MRDSRIPSEVVVQEEEERVQRANDFYQAAAHIRLEVHLTRDDESLSSRLATGQCEYKYTITGRARHTSEFAIQLEELAQRVRK